MRHSALLDIVLAFINIAVVLLVVVGTGAALWAGLTGNSPFDDLLLAVVATELTVIGWNPPILSSLVIWPLRYRVVAIRKRRVRRAGEKK